MIAAVLTNPKEVKLKKVSNPRIKENEVKISVMGCGICASSIPVWEGREWFTYPMEPGSPGHEGWGIIETVGDKVKSLKRGDLVSFLSYHAYADYDYADEGSLVKLPSSFINKPFPGEPLGCAMNIFERSQIAAGDTVAVIGTGFIGCLICQLAKNKGAKVIAVSRKKYALDFAKMFGADEVIPLTSSWEVTNCISEITGGNFCTHVIEATGKQEPLDIATEIVAVSGKIIIAGYHQDGLRNINMQKWNWKGIDVINAHERDPKKYINGIVKAVEAVNNGILTPEKLYTTVLPLTELNKGFELTTTRPDGFMKALIQL